MAYYSLVLQSHLFGDAGNPAINAFTYLSTELVPTTLGANALLEAFQTAFFTGDAPLLTALSSDTSFDGLTVTAPEVPTVLAVNADVFEGTAGVPSMPRYSAVEFVSPRTVANIRPGFKRFGLVSRINVEDGVAVAGYLIVLADVVTVLGAVLTATVGGLPVNFTPIIVKRIPYTAPSGRTAYRLPGDGDPFSYSEATVWNYARITTQNSRKA